MLDEAFYVRVEDLLELEDLIIRHPQVFLIMYTCYIFYNLDHLRILLFTKEGNDGDAVLKMEGKGIHIVINDKYVLQIYTAEDS
jgi:hypothetical protein